MSDEHGAFSNAPASDRTFSHVSLAQFSGEQVSAVGPHMHVFETTYFSGNPSSHSSLKTNFSTIMTKEKYQG